ncbi:hypothetical protein BURMUCGD2M_3883 [Burkholderia multivorans CGD2M]|uniref:Uncharacterized protein n=1 Tax=Burkholderia multivorans CGD2 TaxID=513052 RepID=B9BU83_9BURK|nr:hypothetical protein BURMUCGD2_3895 [Burkholderia multivorans CGD2]EEE11924.1 hypothetical protein BURMUCGD2M_3883 [Burkholderia multivorans CGD2M]
MDDAHGRSMLAHLPRAPQRAVPSGPAALARPDVLHTRREA